MFKADDEVIVEKFKKLNSRIDVADMLEVDEQSLRYFLFVKRPENLYKTFCIPKKKGGNRIISAPNIKLKKIQSKLAYILQLIYEPKVCAFGFVKDRNIVDNARKHTKKQEILNIDLKDFFTQFHFGRVRGMLMAKPYSIGIEAATTIAQIACYNGKLPQGAPTSPILTNMLCVPLDNSLMQFAKKYGLTFTRYADDLTFSSYKECLFEEIVYKVDDKLILCEELQKIFEKHNIIVNKNKITLRNRFSRQETTGIIVNRFPNVKREYYKQLRAILYNCSTAGVYNAAKKYIDLGLCHNSKIIAYKDKPESEELVVNWFKMVIKGKITFIKQVKGQEHPSFYALASKANEVFKEELFDLSYFDKLNSILRNNVFIVQERPSDNIRQGSAFYVSNIGLFTSYHVTETNAFFELYSSIGQKTNHIISNELNLKSDNKDIDYSLFDIRVNDAIDLNIGDSSSLAIGDSVIIAGFPDYKAGDSITTQTCQIVSISTLFGAPFYKVSGRIIHGASGGVVLNSRCEVVGIIKGGIVTLEDDSNNDNQGFLPIHIVVKDLKEKNII